MTGERSSEPVERDCEGRKQTHPRYGDCCHRMPERVLLTVPDAKDALRFVRLHSGPGDTLPASVNAWNFLYEIERYVAHYDEVEQKAQNILAAKKRLAEAEAELRRLTADAPSQNDPPMPCCDPLDNPPRSPDYDEDEPAKSDPS